MPHDLDLAPLLPLRLPPLDPPRHLAPRCLAPHVHRRDHPRPVEREREAREFEERAVLRVRHAVHLHRGCRVPRGLQVDVRERAGLCARNYSRDRGEHVRAAWRCESVLNLFNIEANGMR